MKTNSAVAKLKTWCKLHLYNLIALISFGAITSALTVITTVCVKEVIDGAVSTDKDKLVTAVIVFVGVILARLVFTALTKFVEELLSNRQERDVKGSLFKTVLNKRYKDVSKKHSGEVLSRLTEDVRVVVDGITKVIPSFVFLIVRLLCAFVLLLILCWPLAIIFAVSGVVIFIVATIFRKKLKALHKEVQSTEDVVRSHMQESVENFLAVKAFAVEKSLSKSNAVNLEVNYSAKKKRRSFLVWTNACFNAVFLFGYAFALVFGAYGIYKGSLTYGSLTAIISLVGMIQAPISSLSALVPKYYAVLSSTERILEIEQMPSEDVSYVNPSVYDGLESIVFKDLSFGYSCNLVLENCNLTINKGDFVVVTGLSGIGKSTILKLLLGVYDDFKGQIYLQFYGGSKTLVNPSTRKLFGYVPQGNMISSGTIRENLTLLNPDATQEVIDQALKVCLADEFISDLKQGLDTKLGERGVGLSEGQLQRLAVARAIIGGAPILLLDEATSALDEETELALLNNLKGLGDKTVILVSHKKAALSSCNRRITLNDKQISDFVCD